MKIARASDSFLARQQLLTENAQYNMCSNRNYFATRVYSCSINIPPVHAPELLQRREGSVLTDFQQWTGFQKRKELRIFSKSAGRECARGLRIVFGVRKRGTPTTSIYEGRARNFSQPEYLYGGKSSDFFKVSRSLYVGKEVGIFPNTRTYIESDPGTT